MKVGSLPFSTKSVAMAMSLEISKKVIQIYHLHPKRFHSVKNFAKIGPAYPEIICLQEIIKDKKEDEKKNLMQASGRQLS